MEQMSLLGMIEDVRKPGWPECFKTCKNFSNEMENGEMDYFMDWYRGEPDLTKPRCVVGLKGNNWKYRLVDNVWQNFMKCYEAKEEL